MRLFSIAAVFAVVGMYLQSGWMTSAAIVILAGGLLLRFLPADPEEDWAEDDEGE